MKGFILRAAVTDAWYRLREAEESNLPKGSKDALYDRLGKLLADNGKEAFGLAETHKEFSSHVFKLEGKEAIYEIGRLIAEG